MNRYRVRIVQDFDLDVEGDRDAAEYVTRLCLASLTTRSGISKVRGPWTAKVNRTIATVIGPREYVADDAPATVDDPALALEGGQGVQLEIF